MSSVSLFSLAFLSSVSAFTLSTTTPSVRSSYSAVPITTTQLQIATRCVCVCVCKFFCIFLLLVGAPWGFVVDKKLHVQMVLLCVCGYISDGCANPPPLNDQDILLIKMRHTTSIFVWDTLSPPLRNERIFISLSSLFSHPHSI